MASQAFTGAASGAAAGSSAGPWGAAAGGVIGLTAGLLGDASERKKQRAKAAALEAQAQRRIDKGQQEANQINFQGDLNRTSEFSSLMGRGVNRNASSVEMSLDEIASRASFEADTALSQANYDASQIRADSAAYTSDANRSQAENYLNGANTILSIYGSYNKNDMAAKGGNGAITNNYYYKG